MIGMIVKILDVNNLVSYVESKNIIALNTCYGDRYKSYKCFRVILDSTHSIIITEDTFNRLAKLLYSNSIEIE